jgi:hypothetical protein
LLWYFLFLISYWDELAFWLSSYSSAGITIKRERQGFYLFSCIYHIARLLLLLYVNTTGHGLIPRRPGRAISELAGLYGRGLNMIKLVWLSPSIFPHATSHPSFTFVSLIAHHSRRVTGPQMLHHSEAGWRKCCVGVAGSVETVSLLSRLSSPGARDEHGTHGSAKTNLLNFSKLRGVAKKRKLSEPQQRCPGLSCLPVKVGIKRPSTPVWPNESARDQAAAGCSWRAQSPLACHPQSSNRPHG